MNHKEENTDLQETESLKADRFKCLTAIEDLSNSEMQKLRAYADSRACALPAVRYCADGKDLMQESIARTLAGVREWKPEKVDIAMHLRGCIRSIAADYDKQGQRRSEKSPDELPSEDGERLLCRRAMVHAARLILKPDALASGVFNLLLDGHTACAVRSRLNISEKVYIVVPGIRAKE